MGNEAIIVKPQVIDTAVVKILQAGPQGVQGASGGYTTYDTPEDFPATGQEGAIYHAESVEMFYYWNTSLAEYSSLGTSFASSGCAGPDPTYTSVGAALDLDTAVFRLWDNSSFLGLPREYTIPAASFVVTDEVSYVICNYNGGIPVFQLITDVLLINESNVVPVLTLVYDGTIVHVQPWDSLGTGLANKLHKRFVKTDRFRNESGNVASENGNRNIAITAGRVWLGAHDFPTVAFDSASADPSTPIYKWVKSGPLVTDWTYTFETQYANTETNPSSGGITELGIAKFANIWIYRDISPEPHAAYVLSPEQYNTVAEATAASPRTDLPAAFNVGGFLISRIIIQKNASSGIIESVFGSEINFAAISDHEFLSGLLGGVGGEHYHLTQAEHASVVDGIEAKAATKEETGFVDNSTIVSTYDSIARTVTLTHASGSIDYFWRGIKKSLVSPWTSAAHADADGVWFLFSADGTTFTWSNAPWEYYDLPTFAAIKAPLYSFGIRETHGLWQWQSHRDGHENTGTYRVSGGGLTEGTYVIQDGTLDANVTPGFGSIAIRDEDLDSTVPATVEGTYTTMRRGVGSSIVFDTAATFPYRSAGGAILINDPTDGSETASTVKRYVNVYEIVIPTTSDVGSLEYRRVFLQPQNEYSTLAGAESEDVRALDLGDFSNLITEFVVYTRVTYHVLSSNATTGKVDLESFSYLAGSRNNPVNVTAGTQSAENIPVDTTEMTKVLFSTINNVQAMLERIDKHHEDVNGVARGTKLYAEAAPTTIDFSSMFDNADSRLDHNVALWTFGTVPIEAGGITLFAAPAANIERMGVIKIKFAPPTNTAAFNVTAWPIDANGKRPEFTADAIYGWVFVTKNDHGLFYRWYEEVA